MTEDDRTAMTTQLQRNIVAQPMGADAVHTVIGAEPGQRGPGLS